MSIGIKLKKILFSIGIIVLVSLCFFGCQSEERDNSINTTASTDVQVENSTTKDVIDLESSSLSPTTNYMEDDSVAKNQFYNNTSQSHNNEKNVTIESENNEEKNTITESTSNEKWSSLTTDIDDKNGIVLPEDNF